MCELDQKVKVAHRTRSWVQRADEGTTTSWVARVEIESRKKKNMRMAEFEDKVAATPTATVLESLLALFNVASSLTRTTPGSCLGYAKSHERIRKCTDIDVAFTS